MSKIKKIELLAPAKNLEVGKAAVDAGADAVYIGAPRFGARVAVGNSLEDIAKLVEYAHEYRVKVYVVVNTILYDKEIPEAKKIIDAAYQMGVDALIIQDMAFLELALPPIPLFASTQLHNFDPEKIKFLKEAGLQRMILDRELTLDEIKKIHQAVDVDLEFFVHGALCVSYSGQCYFSEAVCGRSANRGECAQICRQKFSLEDKNGRPIIREKYLLSLKDLNLSEDLEALIEAGITSFKIEGRLKDKDYVTNVVAYYRQKLDQIIVKNKNLTRSSAGITKIGFIPDLEKSFNRGFTTHFIHGRQKDILSPDTQKSIGKLLGKVKYVQRNYFVLDKKVSVENGDGICLFDTTGELRGTNINRVDGEKIFPKEVDGLISGTIIYRNFDLAFSKEIEKGAPKRYLPVWMELKSNKDGVTLIVKDDEGNKVEEKLKTAKELAKNTKMAEETAKKQLAKTGNTIFFPEEIKISWTEAYFLPVAELNALRRTALDNLATLRLKKYVRVENKIYPSNISYPEKTLTYRANVLNKRAENFYRRHGVIEIEPAFEAQDNHHEQELMRCKHCLKYYFDFCSKHGAKRTGQAKFEEPFYLVSGRKKYRLEFDCANCQMKIINE